MEAVEQEVDQVAEIQDHMLPTAQIQVHYHKQQLVAAVVDLLVDKMVKQVDQAVAAMEKIDLMAQQEQLDKVLLAAMEVKEATTEAAVAAEQAAQVLMAAVLFGKMAA